MGTRDGSTDHDVERLYNLDEEFATLGIGEVLELDPRPTFALKLDSDFDLLLSPVFINATLRSDRPLRDTIPFKPKSFPSQSPPKLAPTDFQRWVKIVALTEIPSPSFSHSGTLWTAFRVKRWIVISGGHATGHLVNNTPVSQGVAGQSLQNEPINIPSARRTEIYRKEELPRPRKALTNSENESSGSSLLDSKPATLEPSFVTPGTPDWTLPHPEGQLSSHLIFARSIDWAATPLGDMQSW